MTDSSENRSSNSLEKTSDKMTADSNNQQKSDEQALQDMLKGHGPLTSIVSWFAHTPIAANFLMILVIFLGFTSYKHLGIESFPEIEPNVIGVDITYNTGDAKNTEESVTLKLENALESVNGIKRITSFSQPTGARLTIEKKSSYELDTLYEDVKQAVSVVNLPADAEQPYISKAKFKKDAIKIQLHGNVDDDTLISLAQQLKTDLLKQSSISELSFNGMPEQLISVEVSDDALQRYGLTISDVSNVINQESIKSLSTSIRDGKKKIRLAAAKQSYYASDFAKIIIKTTTDGSQIHLGDIATIKDTIEDDPKLIARFNGQPTIGLNISSNKQTNITKVVEQANEVVERWQDRLPQGVQLTSWADNSKNIRDRLKLVFDNALTGFVLVFIILALFLNIRIAFWVAAGLPFIFFGTFFFMGENYADLTINFITTFGFIMALGIVVDDAVVVGESVYSTRQKYGDTIQSTVAGTMAVSKPTILGVFTTIVTFMSLAFVQGDMGKIYAQFGLVVAFCLLLSIVESKFILPAHLAHVKTHKTDTSNSWLTKLNLWRYVQNGADFLMQKANNGFQSLIRVLLQFRYAVLLFLLATFVFVIGLPMTGKVRSVFFPDIPGDAVYVSSTVKTEAGYQQNEQNLNAIEQQLYVADMQLMQQHRRNQRTQKQQTDEFTSNPLKASEKASDNINKAINAKVLPKASINPLTADSALKNVKVFANSDLNGYVWLELQKNAPYGVDELVKLWKKQLGKPAGTKTLKFITSFDRGDNFRMEISADDSQSITAVGKELRSVLEKIEGVSGLDDNLTPNEPQIRFTLTPDGRALGFTTATIAQQVLQNFGGDVVQRFQRNKDEVKVRVRYPEADRSSLSGLQTANVRTPNGQVVPLSLVATMSQEYTIDQIRRVDGQRTAYLSASINKDTIAPDELVRQIQNTDIPVLKAQFPNVDIRFGGEAEAEEETKASMRTTFTIALLVIYMLLAIALNSYFQPILIMSVIPFGIVGAILGHWFEDMSLSIFSMNGILALTGVVINDSLLLVSKFNENKQNGMLAEQAIAEAATSRFRAVILTSLTTFIGLVPLLAETSRQAQFLKPAAVSLAYGILFATVITLVLIPILVNITQDLRFWDRFGKQN